MLTNSQTSLDELDAVLNAAIARLSELTHENTLLRAELAEQREHMRSAGRQLRMVAERLPSTQADVNEAKAA
jgi:uncharacterized coiled-coil protein SlyX